MYSSTGFTSEQIDDLVERFTKVMETPTSRAGRKRVLSPRDVVIVVLTCLRSNRTQASIADQFHVSQKTISRAIGDVTPVLGEILNDHTPTVEDLDPTEPLIVDGTLLPTWSWRNKPELYSGKQRLHRTRHDHPHPSTTTPTTHRRRKKPSTNQSTLYVTRSNEPSPTSKPGESSTQTTADPSKHSPKQSPPSSHSTSTRTHFD